MTKMASSESETLCSLHPGNAGNILTSHPLRRTLFMMAAHDGHVECVKRYLAHNPKMVTVINREDKAGISALMMAALNGHVEVVRVLLARGNIDLGRNNVNGTTPLMFAAFNGHVEIMKMLLDTGRVDCNKANVRGATALTYAVEKGQLESVKFLLDTGMIDDINKRDNEGSTAFMMAAKNGHVNCVKFLLDTGLIANVNEENDDGLTAVMLAAERDRVECVQFLLETGTIADINKKDKGGRTSLMLAARKGSAESVRFLLQLPDTGSAEDINRSDLDGRTAVMLAAMNGHCECIDRLLDTGKVDNLSKRDRFGNTAFHLAAEGSHTACLRRVLDIAVSTETPSSDPGVNKSLVSLFEANDSNSWFAYEPGFTWTPPYVYDRDHGGQSVLKLVVGRGLARCLACLLLGDLDVPVTTGHAVCCHEGLEHATLCAGTLMLAANSSGEGECVDYVLQYERIRLHTLVVLLKDQFIGANQISLTLCKLLRCLIRGSGQVDHFLRMLCDSAQPVGRCVDFLLSALICQADEATGKRAFDLAYNYRQIKSFRLLLQHVVISDVNPMPASMKGIFVNLPPLPSVFSDEQMGNLNGHLGAFLRNGIFQWSWFPEFPSARHLARSLVVNGYSPGEFEWRGVPSSPLHHAFVTRDDGLVRYLVANLYLTEHDMNHFQLDGDFQGRVFSRLPGGLQRLYQQIFHKPWRLEVLSLVKVSTSLLAGCKMRQESMAPVDSLPIPRILKKWLSFECDVRTMDVAEWNSIDIQPLLCRH